MKEFEEIQVIPQKPKGRPQVKRQRADLLIAKVVAEAEAINNDPLPWFDVEKVAVFGSYLSNKPVLGDLDIAVRTSCRWPPNTNGFARAYTNFPIDCPPPKYIARTELDWMHWPEMYVLKRIKSLGRGISIHGYRELDDFGYEHRVIYEREETATRYPK